MYLGAHLSTAKGLARAVRDGKAIGCDAIQLFSKSPQMWKGAPIAPEAAEEFRQAIRSEGIRATAVHHAYLLNLATPKPTLREQSRTAFVDELRRAELLGADALIFHPGAHTGTTREDGLARIVENLNWAAEATPDLTVRALLENAAGQGTTLGTSFAELAQLLDGLRPAGRFGIALDTCHLFASGIDFRTPESYGGMMDELRAQLGTRAVRAFHLNDSKAGLGERRDRHANIGTGQIGAEGFRSLVRDPVWRSTPGYLETPLTTDDYAAYATDLRTLRGLLGMPPRLPARRGGG